MSKQVVAARESQDMEDGDHMHQAKTVEMPG
jgi:hypothetical protein